MGRVGGVGVGGKRKGVDETGELEVVECSAFEGGEVGEEA